MIEARARKIRTNRKETQQRQEKKKCEKKENKQSRFQAQMKNFNFQVFYTSLRIFYHHFFTVFFFAQFTIPYVYKMQVKRRA